MSVDSVPGEDLPPGPEKAVFLLHPHWQTGVRQQSGISFMRALTPFTRAPRSRLIRLPKTPPHTTITLGMRIQPGEFWETQAFSPQRYPLGLDTFGTFNSISLIIIGLVNILLFHKLFFCCGIIDI